MNEKIAKFDPPFIFINNFWTKLLLLFFNVIAQLLHTTNPKSNSRSALTTTAARSQSTNPRTWTLTGYLATLFWECFVLFSTRARGKFGCWNQEKKYVNRKRKMCLLFAPGNKTFIWDLSFYQLCLGVICVFVYQFLFCHQFLPI